MRKKSREVTEFSDKIAIMKKCDVCRVALFDEEYPYIVPMNFALDVEDESVKLYFHCAQEGYKLDLIAKNPRCCFEMDCQHELVSDKDLLYCTMQYSSVIGQGEIRIVEEDEKMDILQKINDKYHPEGFPVNKASVSHVTVLCLEVKSMTGKSNVGKINMPSYMQRYQ